MQISQDWVLSELDNYNPSFQGVGETDRASIPMGNGELCANVWVEKDGLHFYLSRSDALTELDRVVKLGEYIVSFDPNPFENDLHVHQLLKLRTGTFHAEGRIGQKPFKVTFFIDSETDQAILQANSEIPFSMSVELLNWRDKANFARNSVGMFWGEEDTETLSDLASISESPDDIFSEANCIISRHQNKASIVPELVRLHGLENFKGEIPDLITNRVFGSRISAEPKSSVLGNKLRTPISKVATVRVSTFSSQSKSLSELMSEIPYEFSFEKSLKETAHYWQGYWVKSWVFFQGDIAFKADFTDEVKTYSAENKLPRCASTSPSTITRAYLLSKWMIACGKSGEMPIPYNGALFTTMPGGGIHFKLDSFAKAFTSKPLSRPTLELNPDERSWTLEHLWQNLRLPYFSMLTRGEPEGLIPLFSYFKRFWALNRARAQEHHGAKGQWSTEMTLSCGLQSPGIYGIDREGLPASWSKNRWGGSINLSPGLELCKLMFDYWRFTDDYEFLKDEVIPYSLDLIAFAKSKYFNEETGRIEFDRLNSLETYFDCTNPVAIVCGYRRLAKDLLSIPDDMFEKAQEISEFLKLLPLIPSVTDENGDTYILPAETYEPIRMNVETPEFYAIYPFDLRDELSPQVQLNTWVKSVKTNGSFRPAIIGEKLGTPSFSGWQYLGQTASMLGLVEEAYEVIRCNSALTNPGFIFPAMWGPIYDSVPDVDHGANILIAVQTLLTEIVQNPELASKIPNQLKVNFRLFDEFGKPITGQIENSKFSLVE